MSQATHDHPNTNQEDSIELEQDAVGISGQENDMSENFATNEVFHAQ